MQEVILKLDRISKSFGQTKAVRNVSMELHRGQVLGLVGENGSGKSTLMSLVTGSNNKDTGDIFYKGKLYTPQSNIKSSEEGICILVQECGTINGLNVSENIFLGKEDMFASKLGVISAKKMENASLDLLNQVGATHILPTTQIDDLSFEDRKLVEVCRALSANPEILIVDETTTALSHRGRDVIYGIIKQMKKNNKSVVFISHDLDEVKQVCDSVMVLRDGEYIDTLYGEDITPENMRMRMIGRELTGSYYRDEKVFMTEKVVLQIKDINVGKLKDISFELHEGEILGFGGLTECGMHDLCKVIFGAIKPERGEIIHSENGNLIKSPKDAIANHIAYLPKDRDSESLMLATSIRDNITVTSFDSLKKGMFIWPKDERELANKVSGELSIKMQNVDQLAKELSGGNKQKVVVAKWLANDSEILIMDCPTRGIDIGVKASIYALMEEMISQGKSIIMVSEEIPELLAMSDNILIMKDGIINGKFSRNSGITEQTLIEKLI